MIVLIVEDDVEIRTELALVLADEGHVVHEAADGAIALAWLERAPALPAVILLDLMMPVMDGWEFRKRQRGHPRLQHVPVVVISAAGDAKSEALALEAAGVLVKPFDGASLVDTLAALLTAS